MAPISDLFNWRILQFFRLRCALGGLTGLAKKTRPGGPQSSPQSGPLNEPTSGGGSGESVTGGVTDQPTFRRAK